MMMLFRPKNPLNNAALLPTLQGELTGTQSNLTAAQALSTGSQRHNITPSHQMRLFAYR